MMSRCAVCGLPTDLALTDVLTEQQMKDLGGALKIPLIGTCGDRACVDQEVRRQKREA